MIVSHPHAVDRIELFYDYSAPASELAAAKAVEAAFDAAHPEWYSLSEDARYARITRQQMHDLNASYRAKVALTGTHEFFAKRHAADVARLLAIFRTHNRLARQASTRRGSIMNGNFPSHSEMLNEVRRRDARTQGQRGAPVMQSLFRS